jgi:hypothetical protein
MACTVFSKKAMADLRRFAAPATRRRAVTLGAADCGLPPADCSALTTDDCLG